MERRKFIKRISFASAAVPLIACSIHNPRNNMPVKACYTHNPSLPYAPGTKDYPETPLDEKGLFMNEEHVFQPNMADILKWKLSPNPYREEKKHGTDKLQVNTQNSLDDLPDNSISHNHRDHCDKESIELLAGQNPETTWLCGLKLDSFLLADWTGSKKIRAAGWYQQYKTGDFPLKISFLPTRHWSRRGLFDTNATLRGAFLLESNGKKIYFGSDSGYADHLKKTHELFGNIDYYLAGVGAFAPRWFMSPSHMHPDRKSVV